MMAEVLERTDAALGAHAASQPGLFRHFRFIYSAVTAPVGSDPVCGVSVRVYTSLERRRRRYTQTWRHTSDFYAGAVGAQIIS